MACSCNRNNRGSNNFGCRRYAQNTRWPSSGCGNYYGPLNGYGSSCCFNPYGSCGGCSSCGCNSNGCSSNGCNSGSGCISPRCSSARFAPEGRYMQRPPCFPYGCENDLSPFYRGPCGPVYPVCGCNGNCMNNCCCPQPCICHVYGSFQQSGSLVLDEGGAIPFSGASTSNGIFQEDGELTLEADGIYMVTLNITIPANTTLATQLTIRQNGNTVSGGTLTIDKTSIETLLQTGTQVIISACAGDRITVNTSQALNLTADSASSQIAALTILKIA